MRSRSSRSSSSSSSRRLPRAARGAGRRPERRVVAPRSGSGAAARRSASRPRSRRSSRVAARPPARRSSLWRTWITLTPAPAASEILSSCRRSCRPVDRAACLPRHQNCAWASRHRRPIAFAASPSIQWRQRWIARWSGPHRTRRSCWTGAQTCAQCSQMVRRPLPASSVCLCGWRAQTCC